MEISLTPCLVGVVAVLINFKNLNADPIRTEDGLELLFRERTSLDWQHVWHSETHSRCRDKLVRHLYWACEKDIYHLARRSRKRTDDTFNKYSKSYKFLRIWQLPELAQTLLRTRRSTPDSITNECCTKVGCNWEEYAEYCPSNKRRNHY